LRRDVDARGPAFAPRLRAPRRGEPRDHRDAGALAAIGVLVALATPSCSSPAPPPRDAAALASLPNDPGPLDALTRRYARLRQRLEERGEALASGPARWFVLDGEGAATPLDLPTDRCSTFVALGSSGLRELHLTLYDGEGREVAVDAIPGEGALVHVCPDASAGSHAPHHLVATSESGAGALLVAGFTTGDTTRPNFDRLFDGLLAPQLARDVVAARLAQAGEPLLARGLTPLGEASFHVLAEGGVARRTESLTPDTCYTVVASATTDLTDVDLFAYDSQGVEIARDLGHDAAPALRLCPLEAGPHTFEARAFAGAGGLGLEVFAGPVRAAALDAASRPGEEVAEPRTPPDEREDLTPMAALEPVLAGLAARGYGRALPVEASGLLAPGDERAHVLPAPAGCVVVLAAGSGRGADLDLAVIDARGEILAEDTSLQTVARAAFCHSSAREVRASLKAFGRAGHYALAMVPAPRAVRTARALRLDEARASLMGRGYRSVSTREQVLVEGARHVVDFPVRAGTCAALAVAGDPGLSDVDLFLHDATSKLLARDSGPAPFASISRCAEADETLRVEVLAYRGNGGVAIERLEVRP
jgi:hypothetical protein